MNNKFADTLPCPDPEGCRHFIAEIKLRDENKRLRKVLKELSYEAACIPIGEYQEDIEQALKENR